MAEVPEMTEVEAPRVGRRAVLGAALGGAAAAAAAVMSAPTTAFAANGDVMHVGEGHAATATTSISATGGHAFLAQSDTGDGLRGWSDGANSSGVFGFATASGGFGVYGKNGGRGVAALGTYDAALWASTVGWSAPLALKVEGNSSFTGKATFSRSGRARVSAGARYVDADLRAKGGLTGTPLCFANLLYHRTGVYVAAVRPNWPIAGKMRIYLNKAVGKATNVAWVVLG
jgi:hypothetical protein